MSERYTKVFSLTENQYGEGSPVIISAGALLKDNTTGKVLAQLKIKNISEKELKAVTVKISPKDTTGKPLGEEVTYQYLDLKVERDAEFGSKTPVELPDDSTRGFSVKVAEAIYSDNSSAELKDVEWEPLSEPVPLEKELADYELLRQYRINYGEDCKYRIKEEKDLWICTCGAINREGEDRCHKCKRTKENFKFIDKEKLSTDIEKRKESERAEAVIKAQKTKKPGLIVALVAVFVIGASVVTQVVIPGMKYNKAERMLAEEDYEGAIAAFEGLGDYKDASDRSDEIRKDLPNIREYEEAEKLLANGNYEAAAKAYESLGDFRDSRQKMAEANMKVNEALYSEAESLLSEGDTVHAAMAFGQLGEYKDSKTKSLELWDDIAERKTLACGYFDTITLRNAGNVTSVGGNSVNNAEWRKIAEWTDIISVGAGGYHAVGLRNDGTVAVTGNNEYGQCDVSGWGDIVAIAAGYEHTVGLKTDGTVIATGNDEKGQCDVDDWSDIIAVDAGMNHTVGLKSDKTVIAAGNNSYGQCNVKDWKDIKAISASRYHTVGLRSDGTVVAAGSNKYGQSDVSDWTDIVAIATGDTHTVGLKSDGTVVATGFNEDGRCNVSEWTDIMEISASNGHTAALEADGTALATGYNEYGQCNVSGFTDIKLPNRA